MLLKQLSLTLVLVFQVFATVSLSSDRSPSRKCFGGGPGSLLKPIFSSLITADMSDPFCCVTWNTYVATQAQKRGFEEVGGEDEDPAITRRRQQKRKKLKKAETIPGNRVSGALPSPGIRVLPNSSIEPTASSSTVTPLNIESQTDGQSLTDMMRFSPDVSPEPVHLPAPLPEELTAAGRPIRSTRGRLPARYHDILPRGTPAVVTSQIEDQERTQLNRFGLWREYPDRPSYDPDGEVGIQDLSNLPCHDEQDDDEASKDSQDLEDSPLNPTQTLLMGWQNNGNSTKSNIEMDGLARIIQRPEFRVDELRGYNAQTANEKITKADENWERNRFKDSFTETSCQRLVLVTDVTRRHTQENLRGRSDKRGKQSSGLNQVE
ncbi:hypothetical protein C8R41DRAFT_923964 [Lentinula lateritia]|uniref:Uncharacterized protein n=1 Tax=Lentinula lateritia TaxID=40482 RepID=A0ABQ8V601_9AGAR|nr:hypothetical protein C8R41DRAFT_923964 [Lentinula lateritia]